MPSRKTAKKPALPPAPKTRVHYTAPYLLNPQHRVTVDLVGLGGTGSQVLTMLGRLNATLVALQHPGLHVRAWDPDTVSEANTGRQLFSSVEVGVFKATALVSRVNRFFGTDWEAHNTSYCPEALDRTNRNRSNVSISCVDTIAARMAIGHHLESPRMGNRGRGRDPWRDLNTEASARPLYWLDFGNAQKTGQVVLGTVRPIEQPEKLPAEQEAVGELPHVLEMFPALAEQDESASGPSCSLAEALTRQDLFINSTLCNLGMAILWKLFREYRIVHHGVYLNLDTLNTNPINV